VRRVFHGAQAGTYVVTNQHPRALVLTREDKAELRLAPLERRDTTEQDKRGWADVLTLAEERRHVIVEPPVEGGFVAHVVGGAIVTGAAIGAAYWFGDRPRGPVMFAALLGAVALGVMVALALWSETARLARQGRFVFALVFAFAVAVAGPIAAVWFGTGVREVALAAYIDGTYDHPIAANELMVLRVTEVIFIVIASILPALLYFVYDRQRLSTQRRQFERYMMRFDPSVKRLSTLYAKYREAMEEAFGREREGGRLPPGRPLPLVVATLVITLGWGITLLSRPLGPHQAIVQLQNPKGLVAILTPAHSPLVFGFLGAYFFTLQVIARGYARNDLRPKTYSQVTTRLLIVAVAAWVIEVVLGTGRSALIAAFMVGIVPDTLFYWIREVWGEVRLLTRRRFRAKASKGDTADGGSDFADLTEGLIEPTPLTRLDGIDLYDRFRLADEGVTTVEALAHADVPQLMLRTRIPAPQLLDWVDQAILYIHLGRSRAAREHRQERLAGLGIRTATGVLCSIGDDRATFKNRRTVIARAIQAESHNTDAPTKTSDLLAALDVLVCTLKHETWTVWLQEWHKTPPDHQQALVVWHDGTERSPAHVTGLAER
jgi:hypothetical protein